MRRAYNQITEGTADDRQRARLQQVFIDWLVQRFSELGMKRIEQMLIGQLPNLRETQAEKESIAIGKQEGREEGREQGKLIGQVRALQETLGFEPTESEVLAALSIDVLTSRSAELRAELHKRR